MIWNKDYEQVSYALATATEQHKKIIERALEYARNNLTDGWEKDVDDFIVIRVEGYDCIALVTSSFVPLEVCERVFPYDNERIYPVQEIEMKVYFRTVY